MSLNELGALGISLTSEGVQKCMAEFNKVADRLQKIESEMQKSAEKTGKVRADQAKKAADAQLKEEIRIKNAINNLNVREAQKEIREAEKKEKKKADNAIREAKRAAAEQQKIVQSVVSNIASSFKDTISTIGRIGGGILALGGGLSIGQAASSLMSAQKMAASVAVSSRTTNVAERVTYKEAFEKSRALSLKYNMDQTEILSGVQSYAAKTGKGKSGMGVIEEIAKISKAEGVDIKELSTAIGIAVAQNPKMTEIQQVDLMRRLVAQGKEGSVEIKDLASTLPVLMATSVAYKGDQYQNQTKLATLSQFAIKTAGNPEEAATSVSRLASDAMKHKDKISALVGHDVMKGGAIEDPFKLISEVLGKTKGNMASISKMFGERSIRVFEAMKPIYEEAESKQKGTGAAAVEAELNRFNSSMKLTDQQLEEDIKVRQTSGARIEASVHKMQIALEDELAPMFEKLAPKIEELIPKFAALLKTIIGIGETLANHPWALLFGGLALKVSAVIVAEIAKAKIGQLIKSAFSGPGGGGGGAGVPGVGPGGVPIPRGKGPGFFGKPGVGGIIGAGALGITIGAAVGGAIYEQGVQKFEEGEENMKGGGSRLNRAREIAAKGGKATPEEIAELNKLNTQAKQDVIRYQPSIFNQNSDVEKKTLESYAAEMQKLTLKTEAEMRAAKATEAAAAASEAAAKHLETASGKFAGTAKPISGQANQGAGGNLIGH